jgi:predicted metalloprotease with PDZ domain
VIPVQLLYIAALSGTLSAPSTAKREPQIYYTVRIDTADLSGFDVTMQIEGAPRSIRLSMAIHPEYDDRFWRYVRNMRAESMGKPTHLAFAIEADNAWRIYTRNGFAIVHYRIELPRENPTSRAVWHTTLRADGASINSTDTFLYLTDFPLAPIKLNLEIPERWEVATWLDRPHYVMATSGGRLWRPPFEGTTSALLDSPILLGAIRGWGFTVKGDPYGVAYWPLPNATPFDTTQFVDAIRKVAEQAQDVFSKPPEGGYVFLLEDGAWGALEHANSVTIGMPSRDLAANPRAYLTELAHEFFHTWNLVRLYPEGRGTLNERPPAHTTGLWLSEGITMYYAEALTRRAGFPERGRPRTDLLAEELESYYGSPGNMLVSPELASSRALDTTGINEDYEPNYYVQGRLIGTALDLLIADSTSGRRGLDDVMRALYSEFASKRGFSTADVERSASTVCGCDLLSFFDEHVRNSRPLDFNNYLRSIGYRVLVDTTQAADSVGTRLPDLRIWVYPPRNGGRMRVMIPDPSSVWAKSGLHTGMDLVAFNGAQIDSLPDFRRAFQTVKLGDVVTVDIVQGGKPARETVDVTGYDRPRVRIVDAPAITSAQLERRRLWLAASPN